MPGEGTHKIQQHTDSPVDIMVRLSYGTTLYPCPLEEMVNKLFSKMTNSFTYNSYSKVYIYRHQIKLLQNLAFGLSTWPSGHMVCISKTFIPTKLHSSKHSVHNRAGRGRSLPIP